MKRILLLLGFVLLLPGTVAHAEEVKEVESNSLSGIDFENSITEKRTRSGESYIYIDGDKWDQAVKDAYREEFPNYEGEVRIIDKETKKETTFNETVKEESPIDRLGRALSNVGTKGTPNSSVGKVYMYFYKANGEVVAASGSAFKVKDNLFGTAGHVVYDRSAGLGWVKAGAVNFELTPAPTGGAYATANYTITAASTNSAWTTGSLPSCWKSDFGSIKGKLVSGTKVPPNLSVLKDPPSSVGGRAFGYPGTQGEATFSVGSGNVTATNDTTWLTWMYISNNLQVKKGMSGGPLVNSNNQVIGINSNIGQDAYGNPQYRFVRLRQSIYNLWFN